MQAFEALGLDFTYFYQLLIVIVFYFIFKKVWLSKLLNVLQLREAQTSKKTEGAQKSLDQAKELELEYEESMKTSHAKAQSYLSQSKSEIMQRESKKLKEQELVEEESLTLKRSELSKDMEDLKKEVLKEADSLSKDFITKVVQ